MRQMLAGGHRHAFGSADGDLHASAILTEPGMALGEEALVYDNFAEWAKARNCYSVRTSENSFFFVADLTAFKQLANLVVAMG
jgi:hypothetical protein